jgi:O-acetylserine/cysteine efflux transporter
METMPHRPGITSRDIAIIVGMNLMWGLNHVAVKEGVDQIAPLTAGFLRQVIVFLVCLPWLRIATGRMRDLIMLGILSGGMFYIATNLALASSSHVGALAIAAQLSIPFSITLAVVFLGERIGKVRIAAISIAMLGAIMLVFDPAMINEGLGLALTAVASFIWAICSLIQRRLAGVPVLTIYAWIGCIGSAILLPSAALFEPAALARLGSISGEAWGWVLFSALGSTLIGQGAMSYLIQRHPVSTVVPMTLPTPVVAVIAASIWFGTPMTVVTLVAGMMVLGGVAVIAIRTSRAS